MTETRLLPDASLAACSIDHVQKLRAERQKLRQILTENGAMPPEGDDKANMDDFPPIIGECTDMCPEFERWERQQTGRLSSFEISGANEGSLQLIDHAKAVKAYGRAAAGIAIPLPIDIRTPATLQVGRVIRLPYVAEPRRLNGFHFTANQ